MVLQNLKIENGFLTGLLDEDENIIKENLKNLTTVMTVRRIQIVPDMALILMFIVSLVFPPLLLLWIWWWFKMYKNRDKRFLMLSFKNKHGDITERDYIIDKEEKEAVFTKVEEIKELVNKMDDIKVEFVKMDVLKDE